MASALAVGRGVFAVKMRNDDARTACGAPGYEVVWVRCAGDKLGAEWLGAAGELVRYQTFVDSPAPALVGLRPRPGANFPVF